MFRRLLLVSVGGRLVHVSTIDYIQCIHDSTTALRSGCMVLVTPGKVQN